NFFSTRCAGAVFLKVLLRRENAISVSCVASHLTNASMGGDLTRTQDDYRAICCLVSFPVQRFNVDYSLPFCLKCRAASVHPKASAVAKRYCSQSAGGAMRGLRQGEAPIKQ